MCLPADRMRQGCRLRIRPHAQPVDTNEKGNSMFKTRILAAAAALLLAAPLHAATGNYAEDLYREYAAATGDALSFELKVIESGPLAELSGYPVGHFTGTPDYLLFADNAGLTLTDVKMLPVEQVKTAYLDDLATTVDGFGAAGFPVSMGEYRLLEVTVKAGEGSRQHVSLEACWHDQGHCVVFDPAVEFIDSEVNNLRALRAEGWAPQAHEELASVIPDGDALKAGRCGLASRPNAIGFSWTWGRRTATYKNLLGMTMVQKTIGEVRTGLRCDSSCRPAPYGHSHNSSAWANIPFSVACGAASRGGTSGTGGRYVGKSGCAHRTVLGAKFNATAKGVGLGVDVSINSTGSVDQNGGAFQDYCRRF